MTISNTKRLIIHTGNGATTTWPFDFNIPDSDSVLVSIYNANDGTKVEDLDAADFNISGLDDDSGGDVEYPLTGDPLSSDRQIAIFRVVPYEQALSISNQGGFNAEEIEKQLDSMVMQIQQLAEELTRTTTLPPTFETTDLEDLLAAMLTLEPIESDITAVANNNTDVSTVASDISNVNTVAGDIANVNTVADDITNVNTTAGSIADVNTVADNIADIQNAEANANAAIDARDKAEDWADNAEDDPVETGPDRFSAKHWATKAEENTIPYDVAAANGLLDIGAFFPWPFDTLPNNNYLWMNGQTIGNTSSGADHTHDEYETLFTGLWNSSSNSELPILDSAGSLGTRGANATDDWNANKRLPLPDLCGRSVVGKDDMGGITAKGRLTAASEAGIDGTVLFAAGGLEELPILQTNLPDVNFSSSSLSATPSESTVVINTSDSDSGIDANAGGAEFVTNTSDTKRTLTVGISGTVPSGGSDTPLANVQPSIVTNWVILARRSALSLTPVVGFGGRLYKYSTNTTEAAPGDGFLRFDAALGSATEIYIDDHDGEGSDLSAALADIGGSTSSIKGHLEVHNLTQAGKFARYEITAAAVDETGYVKVSLSFQAGNGHADFAADDQLALVITETGDVGDVETATNATIHGYIDLDEIATPADPAADVARLYAFDDGGTSKVAYRDNAGNETVIGGGNVGEVTSLTALKALDANEYDVAIMQGYHTAGDGGGGTFRWDGSDLSTEVSSDTQNGIYVPPDSDVTGASGAWVRQYSGPKQERWYGAVADFTTGDTGVATAGDATFTDANAAFEAGDVGKIIEVRGAGMTGGIHSTTIASITSATEIEMSDAAETTVGSDAVYYYGTDSTAGIQAAFDTGGPLEMIGQYLLTDQIVVDGSLDVSAFGRNWSVLVWPDAATAVGIRVNISNEHEFARIRKLACRRAGTSGTAITVDISGQSGAIFDVEKRCDVSKNDIRGLDTVNEYFNIGIHLINSLNVYVKENYILGATEASQRPEPLAERGILCDDDGNAHSVSIEMMGNRVMYYDQGVRAENVNSFVMTDHDFVHCRDGAHIQNFTQIRNQVRLFNNHFAVSRIAAQLHWVKHSIISGNELTTNNNDVGENNYIVRLTDCWKATITDNTFRKGAGTDTTRGIRADSGPAALGTSSVIVDGNHFQNLDRAIDPADVADLYLDPSNRYENTPVGYQVAAWQVLEQSSERATHTGDTNETTLAEIVVPGGRMGPNGRVRVTSFWSFDGSAGSRTTRIRWGGSGTDGSAIFNGQVASGDQSLYARCEIVNRGSVSSQFGIPGNDPDTVAGWGVSDVAINTPTRDTASDVSIYLNGLLADANDTIRLESYIVEILPG